MSTSSLPLTFLWVLPKWPFPAQDGARVANVTLLKHLTALGHTVDLVAFVDPEEQVDREEARKVLNVRNIYLLQKGGKNSKFSKITRTLTSLITRPWVPLTMREFARTSIKLELFDLRNTAESQSLHSPKSKWDAVVYDGLHPAAHDERGGLFHPSLRVPVIYRAHNREADIWERKKSQTEGRIKQIFFDWQASLVRRFENSVAAKSLFVATVSPDDLASFRKELPKMKGRCVPIGYEFSPTVPAFSVDNQSSSSKGISLLFIGRLDWPPNQEGLRWFLQEVWPRVAAKREDIFLSVAGSGSSSWLQSYLSLPRLSFLGRVPSVEEVYQRHMASLVPIFYGSGTRVKVIEACKFGLPCISTKLGVEGTGLSPGETYFHAETADEWVKVLTQVTAEELRSVGEKAFLEAKERFDAAQAAQLFVEETLSQLSSSLYDTAEGTNS